jgi:hypothetical protein
MFETESKYLSDKVLHPKGRETLSGKKEQEDKKTFTLLIV